MSQKKKHRQITDEDDFEESIQEELARIRHRIVETGRLDENFDVDELRRHSKDQR
jgi:hypothetical protein